MQNKDKGNIFVFSPESFGFCSSDKPDTLILEFKLPDGHSYGFEINKDELLIIADFIFQHYRLQ